VEGQGDTYGICWEALPIRAVVLPGSVNVEEGVVYDDRTKNVRGSYFPL
jgi:hypothetical protein